MKKIGNNLLKIVFLNLNIFKNLVMAFFKIINKFQLLIKIWYKL